MKCRASTGFTLIEMLVATVLASLLIGADLTIFARLGKDRQLITAHTQPVSARGLVDLLNWDLSQAATVDDSHPGFLILSGHGSIDHATLLPDQRWAQVTYRIIAGSGRSSLWRSQEYLDDPARAQHGEEWIADDVTGLSMQSSVAGGTSRLQIERGSGAIEVEWRR